MTVYVYRNGQIVEKSCQTKHEANSFPTPMISRMEPFESPITGREITSWRERDRDMKASDSVDPRDFAKDHVYSRGRAVQAAETPAPSIWKGDDDG